MRILVIGGGGREHALVWKIRQSPLVRSQGDLFCVPGNPGISDLATCVPAPPGGLSDAAALADLASHHVADLTVVGPEIALTAGLVDELTRRGLPAFGPTASAARLEGSKVFAKQFMARHGIPTASFEVFSSARDALAHLASPGRAFPVVVKADGLAAGKGVVVAGDRSEAEAAVTAMMVERLFGAAGEQIVIEECLSGVEASFFALTDGERIVPLATCQDYKRCLDGDRGPNTGGMGAYSPSTEIDKALEDEIMERVMRPAVHGLSAEGSPFRGVLYAGLMLVPTGTMAQRGRAAPMTLEFNARFGDPETQALMPRWEGDIVPALAACAAGRLDDSVSRVVWSPECTACVVMASAGYPGSSDQGRVISGLPIAGRVEGTTIFHAGTRTEKDASGRAITVTAGGRVLAITSLGNDLAKAVERAYRAVERVSFDGMQFRKDIGRGAIARSTPAEGIR